MRVRREGMVECIGLPTIGLYCNDLAVLEPLDGRPCRLVSNQILSDCLSPEHAYRVQAELEAA